MSAKTERRLPNIENLIRQYNLDPILVKAYAADSNGE